MCFPVFVQASFAAERHLALTAGERVSRVQRSFVPLRRSSRLERTAANVAQAGPLLCVRGL